MKFGIRDRYHCTRGGAHPDPNANHISEHFVSPTLPLLLNHKKTRPDLIAEYKQGPSYLSPLSLCNWETLNFSPSPLYALRETMTSLVSSHRQNLPLQIHESLIRTRSNKAQCVGCSNIKYHVGGFLFAKSRQLVSFRGRTERRRLVCARAVSDDAELNDDEDEGQEKGSEKEEMNLGLSREDLERIVGTDDSTFSGIDLATLIRKKYGRSYDVQLIKKEFLGRSLLAMNVMWKYMEQAVSIFIDMDESGGRSSEWIYK
ncbi:uncharacterized protein LOC109727321 isoform X2 [Ananas comosus]|uniref:Uncharacterized protein LOC109727321 isoform X2 n=1 Tax=Ananas comosus TaxID=4615 RepID=A0A6P5GWE4_ANACO|nr:uncharacterized protein LOC109727321 isoform X2 [Ananas comosus]